MSIQEKSIHSCGLPRNADRVRGVFPNVARLLSARKSRGLTQEHLAALAEVDVKTVRKGESNGRLDVNSLARVAAALGLTLPEVLADSAEALRRGRCTVVRCWQLAWLRRDVQQLLLGYDADAVVILPGGPIMPFSGRHQGHAAIASVAKNAWSFLTSLPSRDCDMQLFDSPSAVALQCRSQFKSSSNQLFPLSCTHIFQFKERKITRHQIEYDTLLLYSKLFDSAVAKSS